MTEKPPDDQLVEEMDLREAAPDNPPDLLGRILEAVKSRAPGAVEHSAGWWEGRSLQEHAKARAILVDARVKLDASLREDRRVALEERRVALEEANAARAHQAQLAEAEARKAQAQADLVKALVALRLAGADVTIDMVRSAVPALGAGTRAGDSPA